MNQELPEHLREFSKRSGLDRLRGSPDTVSGIPEHAPRRVKVTIGSDVCWMITIVLCVWIIAAYSV